MTKRSYAEAVLRGMDEYLLEQSLRDDDDPPTIVRGPRILLRRDLIAAKRGRDSPRSDSREISTKVGVARVAR